jgi:hypothetical protein
MFGMRWGHASIGAHPCSNEIGRVNANLYKIRITCDILNGGQSISDETVAFTSDSEFEMSIKVKEGKKEYFVERSGKWIGEIPVPAYILKLPPLKPGNWNLIIKTPLPDGDTKISTETVQFSSDTSWMLNTHWGYANIDRHPCSNEIEKVNASLYKIKITCGVLNGGLSISEETVSLNGDSEFEMDVKVKEGMKEYFAKESGKRIGDAPVSAVLEWPTLKPGIWNLNAKTVLPDGKTEVSNMTVPSSSDTHWMFRTYWGRAYTTLSRFPCSNETEKVNASLYKIKITCDILNGGYSITDETVTLKSDSEFEMSVKVKEGKKEYFVEESGKWLQVDKQ